MAGRVSAALVAAILLTSVAPGAVTPAASAGDSAPNPLIADSCDLDVTLVLDASGSVESSGAVEQVRNAGRDLLEALDGTGSTARITQFGSLSAELAPRTLVDTSALAPGGTLDTALAGYYSPRPPRPREVDLYQYTGGDPVDVTSYRSAPAGAEQFTNWDAGLEQAIEPEADLVLFVTDGQPTAFDLDAPGDPFDAGPPPDVAVDTGSGQAADVTMQRAVDAANRLKATSRLLAVGVGSGAAAQPTRERLAAIAGPAVTVNPRPGGTSSINDVDVAIVTSFTSLADYLGDLVFGLCAPRVVVQTQADSPASPDYDALSGQAVTVTPTVPGGYSWVLPDTAPAPSKTAVTDTVGRTVFQWRPTDPVRSGVSVTVPVNGSYSAGRPMGDDYSCSLRSANGDERTISGEAQVDVGTFRVNLDNVGRELVTCTLYMSYDPRPQIALRVSTPAGGVRGDLDPAAEITSTLSVTNPGNVALSGITLSDTGCSTIAPDPSSGQPGDVSPANGLLDPSEIWSYSCRRSIQTASAPAGGQVVDATTRVTGIDPSGTVVEATASSTLTAFRPQVSVTASVDGSSPPVPAGSEVTFVYTVTNTGNSSLSRIRVEATPARCATPIVIGPDDGTLRAGESRSYSCETKVTSPTTSRVEVVASPVDPLTGSEFASPNPAVEGTDAINVAVASAPLIRPGPQPPTPVPARVAVPEPVAVPVPAIPLPAPPVVAVAPPAASARVAPGQSELAPPDSVATSPPPPPTVASARPVVTLQVLGDSSVTVAEVIVTGPVPDGSQLEYTAPHGYTLTSAPAGCVMADRTATCSLTGGGSLRFTLRATGQPVSGSHEARLVAPDGSLLTSGTAPPMSLAGPSSQGPILPIEVLPLVAAALVAGVGAVGRGTARVTAA